MHKNQPNNQGDVPEAVVGGDQELCHAHDADPIVNNNNESFASIFLKSFVHDKSRCTQPNRPVIQRKKKTTKLDRAGHISLTDFLFNSTKRKRKLENTDQNITSRLNSDYLNNPSNKTLADSPNLSSSPAISEPLTRI